jgi:hypothetical protein
VSSQSAAASNGAAVSTSPSYYGEGVIGSVGGTFFNSIFRPQPKSDPSMGNSDADPSLDSNRNLNVIRLKQVPLPHLLFRLPTHRPLHSDPRENEVSGEINRSRTVCVPLLIVGLISGCGCASRRIEVQVIKTLIASYFDIVKVTPWFLCRMTSPPSPLQKSYTDMVPKIVMLFLVNKFKVLPLRPPPG